MLGQARRMSGSKGRSGFLLLFRSLSGNIRIRLVPDGRPLIANVESSGERRCLTKQSLR